MTGRRDRWIISLGVALAFLTFLQITAGHAAPLRADRDRDGLFESLERRLAGAGPEERLDVVVVLDNAATPARVQALSQRVGGFSAPRRFRLVRAFRARMTEEQVVELASMAGVAHVEDNGLVRAALDSAQASFGVRQARMDAGVDGDGDGSLDLYSPGDLVAAVIDSGIDPGHLDLDESKVIGWVDVVNGVSDPYDDFGHGTVVASVLAGEGDARADRLYAGVAPGAALVGVKVLDRGGTGTVADVVTGIEWAVAERDTYGIEAVNLSLEQPGCSDGTDALSLAVNAARDAGLVVIAAAGNSGPQTCSVGSPGAAAGAITVGAMADLGANGFKQAAFSSRGPTLDGRIKPDVSAPGVSVTAALAGTSSGYGARSGTSLASPFVAGVALLMLDANPSLAPGEVKDAIMATAEDWARGGDNTLPGTSGLDVDYGAGRLDAYAALETAVGADIGAAPDGPKHLLLEGGLAATGSETDHPLVVADPGFPLAATLIVPAVLAGAATPPELDLYLLDSTGVIVRAATANGRHDDLALTAPTEGTYTLRVRSRSGAGDYVVDVSGGLTMAPTSTSPPTITGLARSGETLTATDGHWTGTAPITFTYRWQRLEAGTWTDIDGATDNTYVLTGSDVGTQVRIIVTGTNSVGAASTPSDPSPTVTAPQAPLLLSLGSSAVLGSLTAANEDIVSFDGAEFSLVFDGSDMGLAAGNLDALAFLDADSILLSLESSQTIAGAGSVDDSDIVQFDATSLGAATAGTFAPYFDGSDVGLTSDAEDVDAIDRLADGSLLISTTGAATAGGVNFNDEDLVRFLPTRLGGTTAGSYAMHFDGSDVGLASNDGEDVDAAVVDEAGRFELSTVGGFSVPGRSGANEDVFRCDPRSLGPTTSCAWDTQLVFDGSVYGLGQNNVDAIERLP